MQKISKTVIFLLFILLIIGCSSSINSELVDHKYWKLSFVSNKSEFNQDSILEFKKNNKVVFIKPISDEKHYKIIDNKYLYIGEDSYVNDEQSVKHGINSWLFKLEELGSGYTGQLEMINDDDKEILGKIEIKIKLDRVDEKYTK